MKNYTQIKLIVKNLFSVLAEAIHYTFHVRRSLEVLYRKKLLYVKEVLSISLLIDTVKVGRDFLGIQYAGNQLFFSTKEKMNNRLFEKYEIYR